MKIIVRKKYKIIQIRGGILIMKIIMAFLTIHSALFISLAVIIFGGVVALIARDKQKAFTRLYGLCVEAESAEENPKDRFNFVLNAAYTKLPFFVKAFVSEDSIKYAIEFALTKLKQFSVLKMGISVNVATSEIKSDISETNKVIDEVEQVASVSKVQVAEVLNDSKNVVEDLSKVNVTELKATGEKVVADVIAKDNTSKILGDVVAEAPVNIIAAVKETISDSAPLASTISEVKSDVESDTILAPIANKVITEAETEIAPEVKIVEDKVASVDIVKDVAQVESEIKVVSAEPVVKEVESEVAKAEVIIPIVEPIISSETGIPVKEVVDVVSETADKIAKIQEILASIATPSMPRG
jgi:hypothetical protein